MNIRLVAPALLMTFALGACAPAPDPDEPRPGAEPPAPGLQSMPAVGDPVMVQVPERHPWEISRIAGFELPPEVGRPTLVLEAETAEVSGFAGVNRFTGSYELGADRLVFGPLASTRMAGSPEAMAMEQIYLEALSRIDGWRLRDERLELLVDGQPVLVFRPMAD